MSPDSQRWINHLKLTKHIEGGYFSEVYQSALLLDNSQLPGNFTSSRPCCTNIYFLLEKNQFSALHRIKSDELWHFYAGDPLIIYEIDISGKLSEHLLGQNPEHHQLFTSIKAGSWFGARLAEKGGYALVGCTVSPGFNYADFELADKETLIRQYPRHATLIASLTR
ncbi:MAG: cupin protein [Chitinophagaceae bacterium]|nr:cupin protein [Chitinophagaceae bacterium]